MNISYPSSIGYPANSSESRYTKLKQGEATSIIVNIDNNIKIINLGKISHNNEELYKIFERCKKIEDFKKVDKELILKNNTLNDIISLNNFNIDNKKESKKGELPVGIGPGGAWLTQWKASNTKFETMVLGFEIINERIEICGGIKMADLIDGNSIFKEEVQKSIIDYFIKKFNTRYTYYIVIYKPEKVKSILGTQFSG
jgi:hypothetical protein